MPTFSKMKYLRQEHPTVYVDLLYFCGREADLEKILPSKKEITPYNYSWYIQGEILARLNYERAIGGLK